jgi:hypothetical protein
MKQHLADPTLGEREGSAARPEETVDVLREA